MNLSFPLTGTSTQRWLTYLEAADLLGVSVATFYRLAAAHNFTSRREGKGKVWLENDLLELRVQKVQPKPSTLPMPDRSHKASEAAKREFSQKYGAMPFERPDLVFEWCNLLSLHRSQEAV